MSLIKFIFSKAFAISLVLAVGIAVGLLFGVFAYMDDYTEHGVTYTVPELSGVMIDDLEALFDSTEINYLIVDSMYSNEIPRGSVAEQDPPAGSQVKKGRNIYLTVNAKLRERVGMPDLVNLSLRQAKAKLESFGLVLGELTYVPDIAKNAVLRQYLGEGEISTGNLIFKGTPINLELGDGLSSSRVAMPYVLYSTLEEATGILRAASLNVGAIVIDTPITDKAQVRVYRQIPGYRTETMLRMGSFVD
ncbi:MAG: beta-lactam-binding protein with PASTA domain, partial [Oceanospirillaceae bacterium]